MTDITIPPEALEAGAALIYAADHSGQRFADVSELTRRIYIEVARAAALALLENWPGVITDMTTTRTKPFSIILPLNTETDND